MKTTLIFSWDSQNELVPVQHSKSSAQYGIILSVHPLGQVLKFCLGGKKKPCEITTPSAGDRQDLPK